MIKNNICYGIYDMKNNEQCVGIFDSVSEVAQYFNRKKERIQSAITRNNWIKARYLVKRIKMESDDMWKKHYLIIDFNGNTKEINANTTFIMDLLELDDLNEPIKEHKNINDLKQTIEKFLQENIKNY